MLSPKDIAEKTFDKTFGFGYRMDDVDAFLEQTSISMNELVEINADLERKLEVLADKLTEYREDEESLRTALLGAQKLGDSVIRESKTKAEIVMRDATIKAEAMINNAKRQIDREHESLNRLQREVASFKNRLLALYKQHLELVSALPGEVIEGIDTKKPAAQVSDKAAKADKAAKEPSARPIAPEEDDPSRRPEPETPAPALEEDEDDLLSEQFSDADEEDEAAAPPENHVHKQPDVDSFFDESLEDDEDEDLSFFKQQQSGAAGAAGTISTTGYDGGGLRFGEAYKIKRESRLPRFKK